MCLGAIYYRKKIISLSPITSYCCQNEYLLVIVWSTILFIFFPFPTESDPLIPMEKKFTCWVFSFSLLNCYLIVQQFIFIFKKNSRCTLKLSRVKQKWKITSRPNFRLKFWQKPLWCPASTVIIIWHVSTIIKNTKLKRNNKEIYILS